FGMESLFPQFKIYAAHGQLYEPVDAAHLLAYVEAQDGQILEEGITEAGSMASFTAAGTSYASPDEPMIPFFTFYSMFGFERFGEASVERRHQAQIFASGPMVVQAIRAQELLAEQWDVSAGVWSATSYQQLRADALECERWNRLHPGKPKREPYVTELLNSHE